MSESKQKLPCGRIIGTHQPRLSRDREDSLQTQLDLFIRTKQLKTSEVRNQILTIILQGLWHFTASELCLEIARRFPHIGAASVYRNLQVFVEAGILRETLTQDSRERVFEIDSGVHHDHIVCLDCHALIEFHQPEIEQWQDKVVAKLGFSPVSHQHILYAHCDRLRKEKKKRHLK